MSSLATDLLRPLSCAAEREDPLVARAGAGEGPRSRALDAASREATDEVGALYARHHRLVYKLALRYGRGDAAWAEDVTQDVFLGLFEVLASLDDRENLEGFLYRATTNRCLNKLRRDRFLNLAPVRWLLGEGQPSPRPPDALAIAHDDLRKAFEILGTLPAKERVAFSMYYLDDREQDEIGKVLGHSKGYVCKLIQRAVERLRAAGWEVEDER